MRAPLPTIPLHIPNYSSPCHYPRYCLIIIERLSLPLLHIVHVASPLPIPLQILSAITYIIPWYSVIVDLSLLCSLFCLFSILLLLLYICESFVSSFSKCFFVNTAHVASCIFKSISFCSSTYYLCRYKWYKWYSVSFCSLLVYIAKLLLFVLYFVTAYVYSFYCTSYVFI